MKEWGCRGEILYFANNKMKGAWSLINMHSNVHLINANQYVVNIFLVRERNRATLSPQKCTCCLHRLREFVCVSKASWVFPFLTFRRPTHKIAEL